MARYGFGLALTWMELIGASISKGYAIVGGLRWSIQELNERQ